MRSIIDAVYVNYNVIYEIITSVLEKVIQMIPHCKTRKLKVGDIFDSWSVLESSFSFLTGIKKQNASLVFYFKGKIHFVSRRPTF